MSNDIADNMSTRSTEKATFKLTELPTEIQLSIFSHLDLATSINLAATSTGLRSIVLPETFKVIEWDKERQWLLTGKEYPGTPTKLARAVRMSLVARNSLVTSTSETASTLCSKSAPVGTSIAEAK